jgi:hypothetical protein
MGTLLVIISPLFGIEWKASPPSSGYSSLEMTSDGGFILAGSSSGGAPNWSDIWLQKLDANGNSQWSKVYPDANYSIAFSIDQTSDGGYVVSGWTVNTSAVPWDYQLLLVKVDSYGNEVWNMTYVSGYYVSYVVQHTSDGGCVLSGGFDLSIIKVNANGSEQWNRTYFGPPDFELSSRMTKQTSDGGYAVLSSPDFGDLSWLLKMNESGYPEWNRTISGNAHSLQQTPDDGFLLSGTINAHAMLLKLYSNGSTQWVSECGVTGSVGVNALETSDGGYAVAVLLQWWSLGSRAGIWKIDGSGTSLWCKPLDIDTTVSLLRQTSDGGYILGSYHMLAKASGSEPPISPDRISNIYTTSLLLLGATVAMTAAVLLGSIFNRVPGIASRYAEWRDSITSRYREWRKQRRLASEERRDKTIERTKKGRLLNKLSRVELMALASSIRNSSANDSATRSELILVIKQSLSMEEVQERVRVIELMRHRIRRRDFPPYNA